MYCPVIKYTLREPSIVKKERGSCIVQLPRSFLAAHLTKDLFLIAMQALSPANLNFFSAHPFCRNAVFPCSIHNKNRLPADSTKTAHRTERLKIRRQRATALTSHTQTGSQRCGTASALQSFHTIHTPAPAGSRLRSHRPPEQDFHGTDRTPVRKAPPHTAPSTPCAAVHRPRHGKRSLRPAAQECP